MRSTDRLMRACYTPCSSSHEAVGSQVAGQLLTASVANPAVTINSLLSMMQDMDKTLAVALEPRFRNTATQILLIAAGQAQEPTTPGHAGICSISRKTAVVTRRNGYHQSALEEEVGKLQPQISTALLELCKWECDVVSHYNAFKETFPGRFV